MPPTILHSTTISYKIPNGTTGIETSLNSEIITRSSKNEYNTSQQYVNDRGKKYQNMNYRKSSLRILHLAKSKITDLSFFKITYLINLTEIHLQWCNGLSDIGIESLVKGCLKLEVIDLKSCGITDLSIFSIVKYSKELKVLDLSWCSNITNSGIQGLLVNQSDRQVPDPPYVMSPLPRRRRRMLDVNHSELIPATSMQISIPISSSLIPISSSSIPISSSLIPISSSLIPISSSLIPLEQPIMIDLRRRMISNSISDVIPDLGLESPLLIEEMIEGSNYDLSVESSVNMVDEGNDQRIINSQSYDNHSNIVNNGSHYINHGNNDNSNSNSYSGSNSDAYYYVNSRNRNGNVENFNGSRNDPRMVFDSISEPVYDSISEPVYDSISEPVYVSKLESLFVVWCLHLTDGALLSLAGLPNLKTIDATGCTGIDQENVKIQKAIGITLKL